MADFPIALAFTLRNEGSKYVDDPNDTGAPSKLGVTRRTLSTWLNRVATADDVKALTPASVAPIYQAMYWNAVGGDALAYQPLATILFDCAVLCGPSRAMALYKQAWLAHSSSKPDAALAARLCTAYEMWLRRVAQRPSQAGWLPGWLKRVARCRALLPPA